MKRFRLAFTMPEMLITLAILGIIAAIITPAVMKRMPNKEEEAHKKVTYLVEQIVSQMIANEAMYPQNQTFNEKGFKNLTPIIIKGVEYSGEEKFCELFASQFDKKSGSVVCGEEGSDTRSFISGDNIAWYLPKTDFQKGYTQIIVDIDPDNKKHEWNKDTFRYFIRSNGVVVVTNDNENPAMPQEDPNNPYSITVDEYCPDASSNVAMCTEYHNDCKNNCESEDYSCRVTCDSQYDDCLNGSKSIYRTSAPTCKKIKADGTKEDSSCSNINIGDYEVTVYPKSGYYTNWLGDTKIIKVTGKRTNVVTNVRYTRFETHCIYVNVNDCDHLADPTYCAIYKLKKYKFRALVEGDVDEYGNLVDYSMINDNTEYTKEFDTSFGGAEGKVMERMQDENNKYLPTVKLCGLIPGDYQLIVTPKPDYRMNPVPESGDSYTQNIKLGTKDVKYTVSVSK